MQCRACWLHGGRFLSDVPVSLYVCLPLCVCVCVLLFSLLSLLTLFGWCWFIGRPSRGSVSARTVKHITKPKEKKKKKQQNYGTEWKTEKQNSEEIKKERDRTRERKEMRFSSSLSAVRASAADRPWRPAVVLPPACLYRTIFLLTFSFSRTVQFILARCSFFSPSFFR